MVATDPPDYTKLRRLVSKAFTTATVDRLRPHIQRRWTRTVTSSTDNEDLGGGAIDAAFAKAPAELERNQQAA